MNVNKALKFAVSALAITSTLVACNPAAQAYRPATAAARAPKQEQQAVALYAKAQAAAQAGKYAEALPLAEQAVELSPRDAGYRMLLGDLYLKSGRFRSAETTFGDVLSIDPGNARASLSIVLAQIALGNSGAAVRQLDELALTAAPADVGLAYALAGQPQRAIELLEPAARAPGATARVRQNLALAYAVAGDWQKARITAAQDVSPAELGARMEQWAAFAQPKSSYDQVASLLNVRPVEDAGQPVRLALAPPRPEATALAAAEPAPQPAPSAAPAAAPVQTASNDVPAWVSEAADVAPAAAPPRAAPAEETKPVYAEAVQALVTPQPAVLRASVAAVQGTSRLLDSIGRTPARAKAKPTTTGAAGPGKFAVQLGAFSTPAAVERAWAQAYKRYGFTDNVPLSTTVRLDGRGTFHRLSVAGFASHAEAGRVCAAVKAKGGVCFVREVAGDAPVQWAWRYNKTARG